jgi:hypothetical protein
MSAREAHEKKDGTNGSKKEKKNTQGRIQTRAREEGHSYIYSAIVRNSGKTSSERLPSPLFPSKIRPARGTESNSHQSHRDRKRSEGVESKE